MTTATEQQVNKLFSVTVKETSVAADGYKVVVEIPEFQSRFPTSLTRIPETDADKFQPGAVLLVWLRRGRAKKENPQHQYWDWYWDYVRLATEQELLQKSQGEKPAPETTPAPPSARTSYEDGAARGNALTNAVALVSAALNTYGMEWQDQMPNLVQAVLLIQGRFLSERNNREEQDV